MHEFKSSQFLPIDIKKAWDFFSSPKNLSKITPPEMAFKILSKLNDEAIYEGMIIDYKVKPLLGIALHWQTEICQVKHLNYFTDKQNKGPYKIWEHTHTFTQVDGGVMMNDVVRYQLPFGIIGRITNSLFVRKKIESIFEFRTKTLEKIKI